MEAYHVRQGGEGEVKDGSRSYALLTRRMTVPITRNDCQHLLTVY